MQSHREKIIITKAVTTESVRNVVGETKGVVAATHLHFVPDAIDIDGTSDKKAIGSTNDITYDVNVKNIKGTRSLNFNFQGESLNYSLNRDAISTGENGEHNC